jgi:hypothetical protein
MHYSLAAMSTACCRVWLPPIVSIATSMTSRRHQIISAIGAFIVKQAERFASGQDSEGECQ